MFIVLWASVRSMVRLSLGGYDSIYGYSASQDDALLSIGEAARTGKVPARL